MTSHILDQTFFIFFYSVMVSELEETPGTHLEALKTWAPCDLSYNTRVSRAPSLHGNYSMKPEAK